MPERCPRNQGSAADTNDRRSSDTTDGGGRPDRRNPNYHSEGKGRRRENKADRSHSFHGKSDKKERKYAALQNRAVSVSERKNAAKQSPQPQPVAVDAINQSSPNAAMTLEQVIAEEKIRQNAKSILLTEDNLAPLSDNNSR